jgi:hypothetical protein
VYIAICEVGPDALLALYPDARSDARELCFFAPKRSRHLSRAPPVIAVDRKALTANLLGAALSAIAPIEAFCAEAYTPPDHPVMTDRFVLSAGISRSESNVTANLSTGRIGLGTLIDFEDDLGLEKDNEIGVFEFSMRMFERWRLDAEYFKLDRDNETQASRTLDWGRLSIPITAAVRSNFDLEDARISVGYSFFRSTDKDVGVGLGAHVMSLDAALSTRNLGSERASIDSAPLPVVNFYARMALTDRWLLNVRIDRLSLDAGAIDGSIFDVEADFVYQPWRHFNIGLGYRDINLEATSTGAKWRGKAQVRQNGPLLFISATF